MEVNLLYIITDYHCNHTAPLSPPPYCPSLVCYGLGLLPCTTTLSAGSQEYSMVHGYSILYSLYA